MKTKLSFETKDFSEALAKIGSIVNSKLALPIMGDILLAYDKQEGIFTMTASDTESWITMKCVNRDGDPFVRIEEADNTDPFEAVCLPYKALSKAVGVLPKVGVLRVTFEADTNQSAGKYEVIYGTNLNDEDENRRQGGRFTLPFDSAVEYPRPQQVVTREAAQQGGQTAQPVCRFTVDAAKILTPMKQARVCCASDELRPVMNGECLDIHHDHIIVVASDGHSLFKQAIDLGVGYLSYGEFPADQSAMLLVPKSVLTSIADTIQGDVTITADSQRIEWRTANVIIVCRQIEGKYPNYNSVIPKETPVRIACDRRDIVAALRRVSLFADDSSQLVKLTAAGQTADGVQNIELSADDWDFYKGATERVAISDAAAADGFSIGFKCSTLLGLLGCIDTDGVIFNLADASRAFLLREDDTKSSKVMLCMPMLVNE